MPGGPRALPRRPSLRYLKLEAKRQESHALPQLRWVIARFRDAGEPAWAAPDDHELRQHFDGQLLSAVPAGELTAAITGVAAALREEPVVMGQAPLSARVRPDLRRADRDADHPAPSGKPNHLCAAEGGMVTCTTDRLELPATRTL